MTRLRTDASGQAAVEWIGTLFVVLAALLAAATALYAFRGYGVAEAIMEKIVCAIRGPGSCVEKDGGLEEAYRPETAELVRRFTPNLVYESGTKALPVDFRECRDPGCADGDDLSQSSIVKSNVGHPVTAFTRVVDRRKQGDGLYIQYWLYYANSFSPRAGRLVGNEWIGYHRDDWESVQVRVDSSGRAAMRASSHNGYQGCKESICQNMWIGWTGWSRVSGGSHAGHVVTDPGRERHTPASSIRLIPLETLAGRDSYRFAVNPPWHKTVWSDPTSDSTK